LLVAAGLTAVCLLLAAVVAYSGSYGLGVIVRRDLLIWGATKADDERLSPTIRLALQPRPPEATAGSFSWQRLGPGFEVGEMPVVAAGAEVDRILLARIDPAHYRFQVWNRPSGDRDSLDWMNELGAVLVINGSYFTRYGTPATPLISAGALSGPADYEASHGAFVASAAFVGIRDLGKLHWRQALRDADYGLVSFPLLIGADGQSRVKADARWLANRSFVAQDEKGHIVLGTTKDAFFSLDRLATFLREAPLALKLALNLDGGPIACQAIALNGFKRDFCGQWEMNSDGGELRMLRPVLGLRRWGLPIALAVLPKPRAE